MAQEALIHSPADSLLTQGNHIAVPDPAPVPVPVPVPVPARIPPEPISPASNRSDEPSPQSKQQQSEPGKATRRRNKPSLSCQACTSKKTKVSYPCISQPTTSEVDTTTCYEYLREFPANVLIQCDRTRPRLLLSCTVHAGRLRRSNRHCFLQVSCLPQKKIRMPLFRARRPDRVGNSSVTPELLKWFPLTCYPRESHRALGIESPRKKPRTSAVIASHPVVTQVRILSAHLFSSNLLIGKGQDASRPIERRPSRSSTGSSPRLLSNVPFSNPTMSNLFKAEHPFR